LKILFDAEFDGKKLPSCVSTPDFAGNDKKMASKVRMGFSAPNQNSTLTLEAINFLSFPSEYIKKNN
jgi:hypothetical protein